MKCDGLRLETLRADVLIVGGGAAGLFAALPAVTLTAAQETCVRTGMRWTSPLPEGQYRLFGEHGAFLALGEVRGGSMRGVKSFFEVETNGNE